MVETLKKELSKILPLDKHYGNIIIACAKQENAYINDWLKYHLDIGFDNVILFDNNDEGYPDVKDFIDKDTISRVFIIDAKGLPKIQTYAYEAAYCYLGSNFNWAAFIDIDEFITIEEGNLNDMLLLPAFTENKVVKLSWKIIGDDNIIEGDVSVPIYDRLKEEAYFDWRKDQAKSFVKSGCKDLIFTTVHCPSSKTDEFYNKYVMVDNSVSDTEDLNTCPKIIHKIAYIRHYMTKTLSEYIESKMNRADATWHQTFDLNYFFNVNIKTPQKIEYLKNRGIKC